MNPLEVLQQYSQALQETLKAFGLQQQALIQADVVAIGDSSKQCEEALQKLATAHQDCSTLNQTEESSQRESLLTNMITQQIQQLKKIQTENVALLEQSQHLNAAQLEHLISLHQNTQPTVYGAQGENAPEFQNARSAYDFSA